MPGVSKHFLSLNWKINEALSRSDGACLAEKTKAGSRQKSHLEIGEGQDQSQGLWAGTQRCFQWMQEEIEVGAAKPKARVMGGSSLLISPCPG